MVGAALALALARADFRVALIEAREPRLAWDDAVFDLRVSAITRASQHLLANLGVWDAIADDRATAYQAMQVWDRPGLGEIRFDAAELGEPDLGHIVENRVIVRALWRALRGTGVRLLTPASLRGFTHAADGAVLTLADGDVVAAALVVGADGAASPVREMAGIPVRSELYDQHALVATVAAANGNAATAWQRFLRTGPLALLPVGERHCSIVWSTRPDEAARLAGLVAADFDRAVTEASEARLGRLSLCGERAVFPLRRQQAGQYVLPGLALVGDAAHVIHPLAGQGVNLGFLDVGALVDALTDARTRGLPLGERGVLRRYERARRGHNTMTQLAMDGFKHAFGSTSPVLDAARNLGVGLAGGIGPLRRLFARVALGELDDLPSLNRPRWQ